MTRITIMTPFQTVVGRLKVSTTLLAVVLDHPDLRFETMVIPNEDWDHATMRHATEEEARKYHAHVVKLAKGWIEHEQKYCEYCHGRGNVCERWTGTHWIIIRGCAACGMKGDPQEFARENDAARGEAEAARESTLESAKKQGRDEERARIVSWLREEHDGQAKSLRSPRYHYAGAAEDIEEGKHSDPLAGLMDGEERL